MTQTEYMDYRGDVEKNYTIGIRKARGRVWIAKLHVNCSYEEVMVETFGELEQRFYVRRSDDSFRFIV